MYSIITMNLININNTKDELILLVDSNDQPIGSDTRKNMVAKLLI